MLALKRWEDFSKWAVRYQKIIDEKNAKILEALQRYGPRNIKALAKSINMPDTTVRFRIKKLIKQHLLLVTAHLDFTKLGLARGLLIAESPLGRQNLLREVIKHTDYWNYIVRCYGKFDGFTAYFAFPARYKRELQEYLEEAEKLRAFSNHLFFWITNTCIPYPSFEWYDFREKRWKFRWSKWIEEVLDSPERLPEPLKEPDDYVVLVDKFDLLILKELEKNAMQDFKKIAKVAGITPQSLNFRWYNHITKRKLILQYVTCFQPFPLQVSDFYTFIIHFQDERALAKFSNSLERKCFITSYAKIIGRDSLVVTVQIPKTEFPNLIRSLNSLHTKGIVKGFLYVTIDIMSHERQTVSYEFFRNGDWSYEHDKKLEELRALLTK